MKGFQVADTPPRVMRLGLIALAAVAALAPIPPALVEQWYSRGVYLSVQRVLTGASNLSSLAWLDVLIGLAVLVALVWLVVRVRGARSGGWGRTIVRMIGDVLLVVSCVYLVFLAAWGLNYRRLPLRQTLDFDETRVTGAALAALANSAVVEVNQLYGPAHAREWPSLDGLAPVLSPAFDQVQRDLGLSRAALAGRPKRSMLSWYFSRAAIDGMTDPFALEVLINPEVLPVERPIVVAHEWAHLAGYAHEAEASFAGWVACVRGSEQARYSAWLSLLLHLSAEVPPDDYRAAMNRLDAGPREDLRAIIARVRRSVPMVRAAASRVYDGYLKANRVASGVRSYDEVVTLIAGTRFTGGYVPVLRGGR